MLKLDYILILLILFSFSYCFLIARSLCFVLFLPIRSISDQMVNIKLFSYSNLVINPGDILGILTIFLSLFFIFLNLKSIMEKKFSRNLSITIFSLLLWYLLSAILSQSTLEYVEQWAKLASWMLLIPVGTIIFEDLKSISQLRYWAAVSIIITLISVGVANLMKIGSIAYAGKGSIGTGFYLGFFDSESALSLRIAIGLPLLFLPYYKNGSITSRISIFTVFLLLISVLCILWISVRTALLAILLGTFILLYLSRKNQLTGLSITKCLWISSSIFLVLILFIMTHSEVLQSRFRDFIAYQKEGKIESLGSGRILLLKRYYEEWNSRGLAYKFFGIDTGTGGGQRIHYQMPVGAHNDFMSMLYKGGLVGFFLYILFLLKLFIWYVRRLFQNLDDISHQLLVVSISLFTIYIIFSIHGSLYQILPMSYFSLTSGAAIGYLEKASE